MQTLIFIFRFLKQVHRIHQLMKQSNNATVNRYQIHMDIVKESSNVHIHIRVATRIKYALRINLVKKKYCKKNIFRVLLSLSHSFVILISSLFCFKRINLNSSKRKLHYCIQIYPGTCLFKERSLINLANSLNLVRWDCQNHMH